MVSHDHDNATHTMKSMCVYSWIRLAHAGSRVCPRLGWVPAPAAGRVCDACRHQGCGTTGGCASLWGAGWGLPAQFVLCVCTVCGNARMHWGFGITQGLALASPFALAPTSPAGLS